MPCEWHVMLAGLKIMGNFKLVKTGNDDVIETVEPYCTVLLKTFKAAALSLYLAYINSN